MTGYLKAIILIGLFVLFFGGSAILFFGMDFKGGIFPITSITGWILFYITQIVIYFALLFVFFKLTKK